MQLVYVLGLCKDIVDLDYCLFDRFYIVFSLEILKGALDIDDL